MRLVLALAAAMAWPAAAVAQGEAPPPEEEEILAPPERAILRKPPSAEAMELGRRLAVALHQQAISRRVGEVLTEAEEPPHPRPPDGRIRAISPFLSPANGRWGIELQARAIAHAALVYARRYSVDELRQMAGFFESAAGRTYLDDRDAVSAEVEAALRTPQLHEELWDVLCRPQPPAGPVDGPNHGYVRLPPAIDTGEAPKRPVSCDAPTPARRPD